MAAMGMLTLISQASVAIARSFSSLSYLNAHLVGLHVKEYCRALYNSDITLNISHSNGKPLLEIVTNTFSESLYFVVWPDINLPYINPNIFTLLHLYRIQYLDFSI